VASVKVRFCPNRHLLRADLVSFSRLTVRVNINYLENKKEQVQWRSLNIQINERNQKDRDLGKGLRTGTKATKKKNQINETSMTSVISITSMISMTVNMTRKKITNMKDEETIIIGTVQIQRKK